MPDKPCVILTGGGTGGHVYPALAIIEAIAGLADVRYVGHPDKLESRVVPDAGIPFHGVRSAPATGGLKGRIRLMMSLLTGILHCLGLMLWHRPALVIGVGGYVSVPMMVAAWLARRPTLLHEQNVAPGKANRVLARLAGMPVMTSWPGAEGRFPNNRVTVTGCPVRADFVDADRGRARAQLGIDADAQVLLIMGGSGGAPAINACALAALSLLNTCPNLTIVHATGRNYHATHQADLAAREEPPHPRYRLHDYLDDAPVQMAAADIVLSRSGASTLNELFCAGLPSVLLPSPNVAEDHQMANARFAEIAGAAIVVAEEASFADQVTDQIDQLLRAPDQLRQMSEAALASSHGVDASAKIRAQIESMLKQG